MTDLNDFLSQVERDVRTIGSAGEQACRPFLELPIEHRVVYERAMRFLGCKTPESTTPTTVWTSASDRVRASRLMLLSFFRQPDNPAWSSWLLDRLVEAVIATPGGSVGDLLNALHDILEEPGVTLSETVKNLIHDLVVTAFSKARDSYESSDFAGIVGKTINSATPAQAYLALLAIPPDGMHAACTAAILKGLEGTPYASEARQMLEDDLQDPRPADLKRPSLYCDL